MESKTIQSKNYAERIKKNIKDLSFKVRIRTGLRGAFVYNFEIDCGEKTLIDVPLVGPELHKGDEVLKELDKDKAISGQKVMHLLNILYATNSDFKDELDRDLYYADNDLDNTCHYKIKGEKSKICLKLEIKGEEYWSISFPRNKKCDECLERRIENKEVVFVYKPEMLICYNSSIWHKQANTPYGIIILEGPSVERLKQKISNNIGFGWQSPRNRY